MADKLGSFKLPKVSVRPVSIAEGQRLQRIGRTAGDPGKLRRAIEVIPEPGAPRAGQQEDHHPHRLAGRSL